MLRYDCFVILPALRAIAISISLGTTLFVARSRADTSDRNPTIDVALSSGPVGIVGPRLVPVVEDPVLQKFCNGELQPPRAGEVSGLDFRGKEQRWEKIAFDASGTLTNQSLRGGYFYLRFTAEDDGVMILSADGVSDVFVDGVPRAGDVYGKGWGILPMKLKPGSHELWCKVARGRKKGIRLSKPIKPVYLTDVDATIPDFLTTEHDEKWAAIRIVNASDDTLDDLELRSDAAGRVTTTNVNGGVSPLTVRKVGFTVGDSARTTGPQSVHVSLLRHGQVIDEIELTFEAKNPSKNYRRTFVSDIDGSIQYYGVREGTIRTGQKPALFLSAHGAGVKAIGQAGSYQSKDWGHVIAPTNRREFGFDWEDWGRLDALEVLADAEKRFDTDPDRTYLTGHSMGGHGTWYLGATYPSRWAAIAPLAGWRSFFSYPRDAGDKAATPMSTMLGRATNPSNTLALSHNYMHQGIYIEHGDHDQTVPVDEARSMREHLAAFHPDFVYREEPGGGHWYGVDHEPIFDYFRRHTKKAARDMPALEFRTACPGISATSHFVTLYQQEEPFEFCGVVVEQSVRSRRQRRNGQDINERTIDVSTENLRVFKVDLAHCRDLQSLVLQVDGQPIDISAWREEGEVWLKKEQGMWEKTAEPDDPRQKNPQRYGGFKDAFRHRVLFVYGTHGTDEENAWSYDKARFDAETFYCRGNGSIEIISDTRFALEEYPDRSVIVYGNASVNSAWKQLLADCPVHVRRGELEVGQRAMKGEDFGIYMVRPRVDSDVASVGVVAGTGTPGRWAVTPNRYFLAGCGFPDMLVVSSEVYERGVDGIVAAGYFGNDWTVENGSIVWQHE